MLPTRSLAPARTVRSVAGALFLLAAPVAGADVPAPLAAPATDLLAAVSAASGSVTNLSCTVRRQLDADGGELVSRVVWARGGFLNVQKIVPERRRTVIDGTTVRTAADGEKEPVSFPVADQLPSQAANLRAVPASPEEALAALDPATAEDVAPPAAPFARQVAFRLADTNAPNAVAVLSFDPGGCVARLETFDDATRATLAWTTEFASPFEPSPGLRLFRRIETASVVDGRAVRATSSFDRLRVNEELPPSIFDPKAFF